MTALRKLVAEFEVIEDLSVEGDGEVAVTALHRLVATRKINDAEASVAEACIAIVENSAIIGTTVLERGCHAREQRGICRTRVEI